MGRGRYTFYTKGSEESFCQLAILKLERCFYGGLIEAYNSSSNEPVIAAKSLVQEDAGRKSDECGTIRDNRAHYGHDPDLLVLGLVRAFADGSLDFREILDCKLASASCLD